MLLFLPASWGRLRLFALSLCAVLLLIGDALPSRAQSSVMDECAGGFLYYLSFPDTTTNTWDNRLPSELIKTNTKAFLFYIYSPVDQTITVGRANKQKVNIQVAAGQIYELSSEQIGIPLVPDIDKPQDKTVRIEAKYPVIVYGYLLTPFGCAAYTALPVESWGTRYYAAAWPGQRVQNVFPHGRYDYRTVSAEAPAEIMVIAAYDGTEVTISPTADLVGCTDCRTASHTLLLNSGETYVVQSTVDTGLAGLAGQGDLGGTLIVSSKPVGVISGNTRLMHNAGTTPVLAENAFKDMALEWLSPPELHGTEFAFTPTWDDRSFQPGRDVNELRKGERVRLFPAGSGGITATRLKEGGDSTLNSGGGVNAGGIIEERIDVQQSVNEGRGYKTTGPAFVVASPESVIRYNGIPGGGGGEYEGASYQAWSTYMAELVPREQWTSFAPVFTPKLPSGMIHYLNLVADTAAQRRIYIRRGNNPPELFSFNRGPLPGTDLVWGSMELTAGQQYFIIGDNGVRFSGHVYGSYRGSEEFRPEQPGGTSASAAQYDEDIAMMYGYPLAPSRCLLVQPDKYEVETRQDCGEMEIHVRATNANPVGLRSIILLADSSINSRLLFISPSDPVSFAPTQVTEALLRVAPVDPKKNAEGVVRVYDRARGGVIRIPYRYEVERLTFDSVKGINFGTVQTKFSSPERSLTITNPLVKDVTVRRLSFLLGNRGFRIVRTEPSFDWGSGLDSIVLKSGESLRLWLDIGPTQDEGAFNDSLRIEFGCSETRLPVKGAAATPCLQVGDLDFGTLVGGRSKQLSLELCNTGTFPVSFHDSTATGGGNLLSHPDARFSINSTYLEVLRKRVLKPGECVTIQVRFTSSDTGSFRTTARFWINGRDCRDTSVWTVYVTGPTTGVEEEEAVAGNAVTEIVPNPTNGKTRIGFRLAQRGETRVEVHDGTGRMVALLLEKGLSPGEHEVLWDGGDQAAGVYYVRIRSGAWSASRAVVLVR